MAFSFPFFSFALCPYSFLPRNCLTLLNDGGSSLPYYFNAFLPSRWLPSPTKEWRLVTSRWLSCRSHQRRILPYSILNLPASFQIDFFLPHLLLYFLHSFQMVDMPFPMMAGPHLHIIKSSLFLPSLQMVAYPCPTMTAPSSLLLYLLPSFQMVA